MPKISIEHKSSLSPEDAFEKIKNFFETDQDIRRFDSRMKMEFSDETLSGKVNGAQFKADVSVRDSSGTSQIKVVIDLPLVLTPFKTKVTETIQKKLNKYLA